MTRKLEETFNLPPMELPEVDEAEVAGTTGVCPLTGATTLEGTAAGTAGAGAGRGGVRGAARRVR